MDESDSTRKDFLTRFIPKIRAAFAVLPPGLQAMPQYSAFVQNPSQVLAITVNPPLITKFFVLHLSRVQDSTVWAYGPLQPYELLALLERTRLDPVLQEEVPKDSKVRAFPPAPPTVAAVLERPMLEFLDLVRERLLNPPGGGGAGSANYGPVYHEITLYGDYIQFTPDALLLDWIDAGMETLRMMQQGPLWNKRYTRAEIDAELQAREQSNDWLGTFYFPPIRIGPQPDRNLRERLGQGPNRFELGPVVLVDKVGSVPFLATYYGYFGVQSRVDTQACRLLNLVCGVLHLSGVPSFVVRPRELGRFNIDTSTNSFLSTGVPGNERSVGNKDLALNKFNQPAAISVDQVKEALRLAERHDRDARLPTYVPLLLDSFGRLRSKEWDYAFYSSWMIIETSVVLDWDEVSATGIISQAEYETLRQAGNNDSQVRNLPREMSKISDLGVAHKLTALKLIGRIDPMDYALHSRLCSRRNEILHPDIPATEVDAQSCYAAAEKIVRNRIASM